MSFSPCTCATCKPWRPPTLTPLRVTDGRSERWKAAEARISESVRRGDEPERDVLAIVDEEQAAFDAKTND